MAFGGTIEALPVPLVVPNKFGGTDTITHAGYALLIDPFVEIPLAAYAVTRSAASVQVIKYFGVMSGLPGAEVFETYEAMTPQVAIFAANEVRALEQAGTYTFQGYVNAAKLKFVDVPTGRAGQPVGGLLRPVTP